MQLLGKVRFCGPGESFAIWSTGGMVLLYVGSSATIVLFLLLVNSSLSKSCSDFQDPMVWNHSHSSPHAKTLPLISLGNLSDILPTSCALLCISPCKPETLFILKEVNQIFEQDYNVFIGQLFNSKIEETLIWRSRTTEKQELAFYELSPKDRNCLLSPPKTRFGADPYHGLVMTSLLVQFVNEKCTVFRTLQGSMNEAGMFHSHIMANMYNSDKMVGECMRIDVPDQKTFFQNFLFRSRPVIIEGGAKHWPAMTKWSNEYLKELYGSKRIHIKLTEDGNFEGVEDAKLWESYHSDWIPETVRVQLPYPDLVVVRPATAEMKFSDFLDYIISENRTYSAYLEYSSIPFHLPLLENDVKEMKFLGGLLERKHLNIWLSDGNTLGKLHFDPFDNFLCQVSKSVIR